MKIKFHYSLLTLLIVFIFSGLYKEIILFFLVIILHELGHVVALLLFGQKVIVLNITIVGGILDVEYRNISIFKEIIVSLAGVIVNFILLILLKYLDGFYYQDILIKYNILIICFNLLPIYPLDGFRFLEGLLRLVNDPFKEQRFLNLISIISLIIIFSLLIIYYKSLSVLILFSFLAYHNILLQTKYTAFVLKKYVKRYNYKRI